jgi:hypothetical protein
MSDKIRKFAKQYKGFTIVCIIEIIAILLMGILSIRSNTEYNLNADNLVIYSSDVTIQDYEPVDSMLLDANTLVVYDNKESKNIEKSLFITGRNDENPYGRWIIGSGPLTVTPGVYELEIKYYSLLYDNEVGGNSEDATGIIQIVSENNEQYIDYNEMTLNDSVTVKNERILINSLKSIDDLEIKVNFAGLGDLRIDSITLKELPLWRLLKWLAWLIAFIIFDALYIYIFTDNHKNNKNILAALTFICFFACLPVFENFLLKGHDMDFHLARIMALAENLKAGNIAFPLQTEMANGYGYASPIFYGQIFLYLPAIIYNMGAPLQVCYQFYVIMVNILTVVISYLSFKSITGDKKLAVLGSGLYTLSAYRIVNMYLRAAVGEYTAMMFFPLIICGFIKIYSKDESKISLRECLAIVIGITGLIQSHVLSCEMAAVFIVIFCVIAFHKTFKPRRFIILACTAIVTLLLNLAFLVPFLSSMGMHIRVNEKDTEYIQKYGTYLMQVFGVFMTSGGETQDGMANEMPLAIGFALIIGICIFIWCCINKYKWNIIEDKRLKSGIYCAGFAITSVILSTRFFPWDGLEQISPLLSKILSMVQFPWRYLAVATIFAVITTLIGLSLAKKHISETLMRTVTVLLMVFTVLEIGLFYTNFADTATEYKVYGGADVVQDTVSGEYMLTGTIEGFQAWRSVKADLEKVGIAGYESDHGTITFICDNISDEEQLVQIPIMNYDNYHAYTSDGSELAIENGDNNRLSVWVPSGYNGTIRIQYEIPLLWKIANIVTVITFMAIVIIYSVMLKKVKNGEEASWMQ